MSAALQSDSTGAAAGAPLAADRGAIERFVHLLFCYADPDSFVSLRVLPHRKGVPPLQVKAVPVGEGPAALVGAAAGAAE